MATIIERAGIKLYHRKTARERFIVAAEANRFYRVVAMREDPFRGYTPEGSADIYLGQIDGVHVRVTPTAEGRERYGSRWFAYLAEDFLRDVMASYPSREGESFCLWGDAACSSRHPEISDWEVTLSDDDPVDLSWQTFAMAPYPRG